jgi:hypothetical protein
MAKIWPLEAAGISPELINTLILGQLKEPLVLYFDILLVTRRVKAALYQLMREYNPGGLKISQPDPYTLILKPGSGQKLPVQPFLPKAPGLTLEDESFLEAILREDEPEKIGG